MVDLDSPNQQDCLPSDGPPLLTINHEVAADLDSTNAFEGPEKLLEVWFAPSAKSLPAGTKKDGLKAVSSSTWKSMLDLVNCEVLSIVKSAQVDAYLLSESSMFVWSHKIILKTCGTTTLLLGLHRMLRIAAQDAGFPFHNAELLEDSQAAATPYRVFYSRKNSLFPDRQRGPHRSWRQEVTFLDDMFEGGSAYMVGKMNGDHWYLYMTSPNTMLTPPRTPTDEKDNRTIKMTKIPVNTALLLHGTETVHDETLEVLMTDLDTELAKQFYLSNASAVANGQMPAQAQEARDSAHDSLGRISNPADSVVCDNSGIPNAHDPQPVLTQQLVAESVTTEGHALGTVVSDACGLSAVYPTSVFPDARIDAYLFSPCGFSANGVIPAPPPSAGSSDAKGGHYFTVHVTPEPECSYASFETNVPGGQKGRQTADVIAQVVNIFSPGRFSVTLFQAKGKMSVSDSDEEMARRTRNQRNEDVVGYRRVDRIVYDFEDYDLVFRFYEREGWAGDRTARVGEDLGDV